MKDYVKFTITDREGKKTEYRREAEERRPGNFFFTIEGKTESNITIYQDSKNLLRRTESNLYFEQDGQPVFIPSEAVDVLSIERGQV